MSCLKVFATCALAIASANASADGVGSSPSEHSWTVQDSIAVRYFVTEQAAADYWGEHPRDPAEVSPDGLHFFLTVQYGDLACDCNHSEMMIYSSENIRAALQAHEGTDRAPLNPLHRIRMASTAAGVDAAAIRDAYWETNDAVVFRGAKEDLHNAIFRFDLRSGNLQRLTEEKYGVLNYRLQGDTIVYTTADRAERARTPDAYPVQPIRMNRFERMFELNPTYGKTDLRVAVGNGPSHVVDSYIRLSNTRLPLPLSPPSLSPDNRWAIVAVAPREHERGILPKGWNAYDGLQAPYDLLPLSSMRRVWKLALVDVRRATSRSIFEAPLGSVSTAARGGALIQVLWSADSKRVVLVNMMLPLAESDPERQRMAYIIDYEVDTGRWAVLEPMIAKVSKAHESVKVQKVGWLRDGKALLVTHSSTAGTPTSGTLYTLHGNGWAPKTVLPTVQLPPATSRPHASLRYGLRVELRESENDPPIPVASDGRNEVALMTDDPAMAGVQRIHQQQVEWTESDGHAEVGGLLLPPDSTKPFPLVIQLAAYQPDQFRPDGYTKTGFAAQALAARGIAVLQMDSLVKVDHPEAWKRAVQENALWKEGSLTVERIDAAVDKLSQAGLVDSSRVGVIGFSHTGFLTYYAITHPGRTKLAAAIVGDATTGSYFEYVLNQALSPGERIEWIVEKTAEPYGGLFWKNKETWIAQAPGFNVDRVEAPTLFTLTSFLGPQVNGLLETLGAFRLNGREMDILFFPDGAHQIQRPRQRMAAMQSTLDWFSFWLQEREDADPNKDAQYSYWRSLREHKVARQKSTN